MPLLIVVFVCILVSLVLWEETSDGCKIRRPRETIWGRLVEGMLILKRPQTTDHFVLSTKSVDSALVCLEDWSYQASDEVPWHMLENFIMLCSSFQDVQ